MQIVIPFFAPTARYRFVVDDRGCIRAVCYPSGDAFLYRTEAD
jgi:hypothetical protein